MCSGAPPIQLVASAIDALAAENMAAVPEARLATDMIELQRQLNRLEAQCLRRLEAFDRRGGARVDGPVSTAGWLRCRNQLGPGAAHERVQVARALADRLPATAGALAAGDISYRHAAVLVHGSADLPPHAVVEAEPDLVE